MHARTILRSIKKFGEIAKKGRMDLHKKIGRPNIKRKLISSKCEIPDANTFEEKIDAVWHGIKKICGFSKLWLTVFVDL